MKIECVYQRTSLAMGTSLLVETADVSPGCGRAMVMMIAVTNLMRISIIAVSIIKLFLLFYQNLNKINEFKASIFNNIFIKKSM